MATKEQIDKLIEDTDIVSLVSEYVTLEKAGKNYRGLCPFHNEKTPSFIVSPEKHLAHCFSCKKGGNPIKFLMDIKNISFNDAVRELAKRNGIDLGFYEENKKQDNYTKYYQITAIAQKYYSKNLTATESGKKALEYLHKRGIDDETIKVFGIGLSSNKSNVLYNVLHDSNVLELDMMDLGLVRKNNNGYHDLFTRRIMFPIEDVDGNIIGFSGRIYQGEIDQPKYINSPETFIFKKGLVLYNLKRAIPFILKNKRVVLHEGFMDVIASVNSGIGEAVCSMGTALTLDQAMLLRKYTDHAIICYDGDSAGVNASLKAIDIFTKVGMKVHLVLLPNNLDPDDYVKKFGKEEYFKYFNSNLIDNVEYSFLQATQNRNFKDFETVEATKREVFKAIYQTNSETAVEKYLERLADILKVSAASLIMDYSTYCSTLVVSKSVEKRNSLKKDNKKFIVGSSFFQACKAELRLFNYAKISKEKAIYIDSRIDLNAFDSRNQKLWVKLLYEFYLVNSSFNEADFIKFLDDDLLNCYMSNVETLDRSIYEPYSDEDMMLCIKKIIYIGKNKRVRVLRENINNNNLDSKTEWLKELFDAKKEFVDYKNKNLGK